MLNQEVLNQYYWPICRQITLKNEKDLIQGNQAAEMRWVVKKSLNTISCEV
jgi:hypothetical protein